MSCTTAISSARRHAAHMASTTLSQAAQTKPLHLALRRRLCTAALLEPTWQRPSSNFQQSQSQSRLSQSCMALIGAAGIVGAYSAGTSDDVTLSPFATALLTKLRSSISTTIVTSDVTTTQRSECLSDKYKVNWEQCLGKGTYGSAHIAYSKATNERVALKRISREATSNDEFHMETTALGRIRAHGGHVNINQLQDTYEDNDNYYLVLEYIAGGELFDHLIEDGMYDEADAARLMEQIASALSFLHGAGIVHMDLKPENLLLSSTERETGSIKIIDFGGAYILDNNTNHNKTTRISGTTAYWSPERCEQYSDDNITTDIGLPCYDMWSVGVILFIMLTGVHPFDVFGVATDDEVHEQIVQNRCAPLSKELVGHLSESAIDLMTKLMEQDPYKRITAEQMLHHPWIVQHVQQSPVPAIRSIATRKGSIEQQPSTPSYLVTPVST